ncbi:MAG: D-glycero-beta-D-manno-heptose 1-phosphate adenylyltransferase [Candidatus Caenarcaniphilales bacterium]|nr:D-glycero-beta-D-manno-heptose 1-phosphate adenylyltransferase [Candidatus Caenarcaniphilales bacterium]
MESPEPAGGHMISSDHELELIGQQAKAQGLRLVATNGCFDILHIGHIRYLRSARAFGDLLIVGINSDRSVKKLKGDNRPLNSEFIRAEALNALRSVDYTFIFDQLTAVEFLRILKPAIYVKGGDYHLERLPEYKIVQEIGAQIEIVAYEQGFSTTGLIERMKQL